MIGRWDNIEHLEDKLSLPEIEAIVKAQRQKEDDARRFAAALKGIKLEEDEINERFEQVKRRAEAKLSGKSEDELVLDENFNMDFEVEE